MVLNEKFVLIAEKPDAAKHIAKPFPHLMKSGYIEVKPNKYATAGGYITWAYGHLTTIADVGDIDERLKVWSLDTLPIIPDNIKIVPIKGKEKQLQVIKSLCLQKDIKTIINGCDPGKEGENICLSIVKYLGIKKPIKRLWTSSLTSDAIIKAFTSLKDGEETKPLYYSAYARMVADYYVGLTMTRAATLLFRDANVNNLGIVSMGRVQSPLVSMICERERNIQKFISKPFWSLYADFSISDNTYTGKWLNMMENIDRFDNHEGAKEIEKKLKGQSASVELVEKARKVSAPPNLYNLSRLQTTANKLYKYSPQKTLELCQSLYDNSFLSYPRTDCKFITNEEAKQFPEIFAGLSKLKEYCSFFPTPIEAGNLGRSVINPRKITDHHALIPTTNIPNLNDLSEHEKNIYDLVVRSVIAVHYDNAIINNTKILTSVNNEKFLTTGKEIENLGWMKVIHTPKEEKKDMDTQSVVPSLTENSKGTIDSIKIKEGKTQPPRRYTQGNLINLMKGAKIEGDSKELPNNTSIGTESTRASIISKVLDNGYLVVKNNIVFPTPKAMLLMNALQNKLVITSAEMTARWELVLEAIANKEYNYKDFIEQAKVLTTKMYDDIVAMSKTWDFEEEIEEMNEMRSVGKCPHCASNVVEYEKMFGCQGFKENGCKFSVSKMIAKKKVSVVQMKKLLKDKKTNIIKGFTSSKGTKFDSFLYLDEGYNVKFGFNEKKTNSKMRAEVTELDINCPICAKKLVEYEKFIGCQGYKDGCKLSIPKVICGVGISTDQIEELVSQGETGIIHGFVYNGKTFSKKLCLQNSVVKFKM